MNITVKTGVFLVLFACFQILLVFSALTSYEFIAGALFILFLLLFTVFNKLEFQVETSTFHLLNAFLITLFISASFSHSIPLSINNLWYYFASACVFIFFQIVKSSKAISKEMIGYVLLLVGFVLAVFFIFFFSFPKFSILLPSINVLTIQFGHSHFAALLLLLIPLSWWFASNKSLTQFRFKSVLPLFFYILLFFTFGRFAALIALIQLPFLFSIFSKSKLNRKWSIFALFFVLLVVVVYGYFTFFQQSTCPISELKQQLCKPVKGEVRQEYFKQAVLALKDSPLFGYGPGTFELVAKRYNVVGRFTTAFAHNSFLQVFAEAGLLAGFLYTIFFIILTKKLYELTLLNQSSTSLDRVFFIGYISTLFNSLFDFDWNLFPTFQLSMLIAAVILWNSIAKNNIHMTKITKFSFVTLVSLVLITGLISLVTKVVFFQRNTNLAFDIFPYFNSQSHLFYGSNQLSTEKKDKLYEIYKNHPDVVSKQIDQENSQDKKKDLYKHLLVISPSAITSEAYHHFLFEAGEYKVLGGVLLESLNTFDFISAKDKTNFDTNRKKVVHGLIDVSNYMQSINEYDLAAQYFNAVIEVLYKIENNENAYKTHRDYFNQEFISLIQQYFEKQIVSDQKTAYSQILKINQYYKDAKHNEVVDSVVAQDVLADFAFRLGELFFVNKNYEQAAEMYVVAQDLKYWVFNRPDINFLTYPITNEDQHLLFWSSLADIPGESYGYSSTFAAEQYYLLFKKALQNDELYTANQYLQIIYASAPWVTYQMEFVELPRLQTMLDDAKQKNNLERTEILSKMMFTIGFYEGLKQLAEYYILIGDIQKALDAYKECDARHFAFRGNHHTYCSARIEQLSY